VVSNGGKTIPRWRTAVILKIVISPYLSEKSSDFDEILYTAADFELYERYVIKNEKVALDRLRVRQNVFTVESVLIVYQKFSKLIHDCRNYSLPKLARFFETLQLSFGPNKAKFAIALPKPRIYPCRPSIARGFALLVIILIVSAEFFILIYFFQFKC